MAKAATQNSALSASSLNPAARDVLRTITAQTFERVRHHPAFASKLTTYVNQALLERASRIEDKVDEALMRLQVNTSVSIKRR